MKKLLAMIITSAMVLSLAGCGSTAGTSSSSSQTASAETEDTASAEVPDTIKIGVMALHIISLGFIVSAVSVTCSGTLEGLGMGMASLWISLLRYVVVIIPAAFFLSRVWRADGVFYAFPVTEVVTAVLAFVIYRKKYKV